jgi:hypothetical protein
VNLAHGGGTGLGGSAGAGWTPLIVLLAAFAMVVTALALAGRSRADVPAPLAPLLRITEALERLTGVPGWAAATVGTSLFGLFLAGVGFYRDVGYHIAYGRDEVLFTAPHTEIFLGLLLILAGPLLGIAVASATRAEVGFRLRSLHVPWSSLPLLALGLGAVSGFPIDEIWHRAFGVDVTMWSPPHLLMILGASFSGAAIWLVIAEAGVPVRGRGRVIHTACAIFTLLGLNAPLAEFAFGVPQWQQLYHPVISLLGAGAALVAARIVLGRGGAIVVALGFLAVGVPRALGLVPGLPVELRPATAFIGSAVAVELAGLLVGTRPAARFAATAAAGIGTLGLATEWLWNTGAHQPWSTALLPEALLLGAIAAGAAAVLGTGFGQVIAGPELRLPTAVHAAAALGVLVTLAVPFPRADSAVHADLAVERAGPGEVRVQVTLDPPDAAEDARWFQVLVWQGGERVIASMERTVDGRYRADGSLPIDGTNKSMLRLQRGAEMVAVPIRLPPDPEIGAAEIAAEDRSARFTDERAYLQREVAAHDAGAAWLRPVVTGFFLVVVALWAGAFAFTSGRLVREPLVAPARSGRDH